jgi:hypothetical protein
MLNSPPAADQQDVGQVIYIYIYTKVIYSRHVTGTFVSQILDPTIADNLKVVGVHV